MAKKRGTRGKGRRRGRRSKTSMCNQEMTIFTIIAGILLIGALIALIYFIAKDDDDDNNSGASITTSGIPSSIPSGIPSNSKSNLRNSDHKKIMGKLKKYMQKHKK
jgi:hypothetical protein